MLREDKRYSTTFIETVKAYVALAHPVAVLIWFVATILFSCVAVQGIPNPLLLFRMVVVVVTSQICIGSMNEYCDRAMDTKIKPWRPIPSGRISERAVILVSITSFVITILVAANLGTVGVIGALVGTSAGLVHNFGFKKSLLSWLPFIVGYSLHPIWVWTLTGHFKPLIAILPFYALPLIIGLHLADQLPDMVERELGVFGLVHWLGPHRAPKVTAVILICAPLVMLFPLMPNIFEYPKFYFIIGSVIYYAFLMFGFWKVLSQEFTYHSTKLGFIGVELGSLALITTWLIAVTWS